MNPDLAYVGAAVLNDEQAAAVRYVFVNGLTEAQAAVLMSELRSVEISRDRVHRILLTSRDKMRRAIESHLTQEKAA